LPPMCLRGRFDRLANQSPVWTLASNPNTYEAPMRQQQTAQPSVLNIS